MALRPFHTDKMRFRFQNSFSNFLTSNLAVVQPVCLTDNAM